LAQDAATTPGGFWLSLHALFCRAQPADLEVKSTLLMPAEMVEAYRRQWSDPQANRAALLRRIEETLSELREREKSLRTGPEAVQRAQAEAQAALIQEPKTTGLWLRYYHESHTELICSMQKLRIVQAERRAAEAAAEEAKESTAEAAADEAPESSEAVAKAPAEGVFPNDPKVQDSDSQDPESSSTCDTSSGVNSETRYRAMRETFAILEATRFAEPVSRGAPGGVSG
jgi:hypothetical protein